MKTIFTLIIILAFAPILAFSQTTLPKPPEISTEKIPENVVLNIQLVNMPGIKNKTSKWEISYELRLISEKELFNAMTGNSLKLDHGQKIGEFVAKGSFAKNILQGGENQEISFSAPLSEKVKEKLAFDLLCRGEPETVEQNNDAKESLLVGKTKKQYFIMYANALIYDAKLKKNIIVPLDRVLPFESYPDVKIAMTIEIDIDGNYFSNLVLAENREPVLTTTLKQ